MFARTAALGAALLLASSLIAQENDEEAQARRLQALVEESVRSYDLLPDSKATSAMRPIVALRWRNASRGQLAEDLMVLWIHYGRPQVVGTIFPWRGQMCHELASVSRQGKLIARDKGTVVWSPVNPGAEFKEVPNAAEPADTEAGRLRQMKSLASQFSSTLTGWKPDDSDREELRLLPRPLYRYEMKARNASHADLLDGAVFAFVQGTDPEAVLLLEAHKEKGRFQWQYAFARATSGGLEARLGDKVVWTATKNDGRSATPQNSQVVLRRPIEE